MKTAIVVGAAIAALVGTSAFAADMPVKAAPMAPAPALPSWTGLYIGLDLGGAWMNDRNFTFADLGNAAAPTCALCTLPYSSPGQSGNNATGAFGGIYAGWNWQFVPQWVAGVEGDISWTNLNASSNGRLFSNPTGTTAILPVPGSNLSFQTEVQWIATARARFGYLWTPNLLLYATGGGAWARINDSANATCPAPTVGGCGFLGETLTGAPFSHVNTESGWVAGGGLEWQVIDHVRLRVEYLYYGFNNDTTNGFAPFVSNTPGLSACLTGPCLAHYGFNGNLNVQTVRGGISWNY